MLTVCPFCHGRGVIKTKNSIEKCYHCEGTGQFIYDDDNRPEFLGMKKEEYMDYKKPYIEVLEMVKNIEINALAKIGDE
jgi:RecJ-like exonuclease